MTEREAAIVSAYTGILLGSFSALHKYAEDVLGHPVWTHEFASQTVADALKAAAKPDFIAIEVTP